MRFSPRLPRALNSIVPSIEHFLSKTESSRLIGLNNEIKTSDINFVTQPVSVNTLAALSSSFLLISLSRSFSSDSDQSASKKRSKMNFLLGLIATTAIIAPQDDQVKLNNVVIVRVWLPDISKNRIGHVSLETIDSTSTSTYISLWPSEDYKTAIFRDLDHDIKQEGGFPDEVVLLEKLDIQVINKRYREFLMRPKELAYKLVSTEYNCGAYALAFLKEGGISTFLPPSSPNLFTFIGNKYDRRNIWQYFSADFVTTPAKVLSIANAAKQEMNNSPAPEILQREMDYIRFFRDKSWPNKYENQTNTYLDAGNWIKVHIWTAAISAKISLITRSNVGHVSVETPNFYASIWPNWQAQSGNRRNNGIKTPVPAYETRTYQDDCSGEGKEPETYVFRSLDGEKISDENKLMRREWTLKGNKFPTGAESCSSASYRLLKAGGINKLSWHCAWLDYRKTFWPLEPHDLKKCVVSAKEAEKDAEPKSFKPSF